MCVMVQGKMGGLVMGVNGRCKSEGKGELRATDVLKEDIRVLGVREDVVDVKW